MMESWKATHRHTDGTLAMLLGDDIGCTRSGEGVSLSAPGWSAIVPIDHRFDHYMERVPTSA